MAPLNTSSKAVWQKIPAETPPRNENTTHDRGRRLDRAVVHRLARCVDRRVLFSDVISRIAGQGDGALRSPGGRDHGGSESDG